MPWCCVNNGPPPPFPSFPAASVQGREIFDPVTSSQEMQEEDKHVTCQRGDSISKIPILGNSIGQMTQDPQLVDDTGEKKGRTKWNVWIVFGS